MRSNSHSVAAKIVRGSVLAASLGSGWLAVAEQTVPDSRDWKLVRSVKNPYGGTHDLVLIPEGRRRDEAYYLQVADALCGKKVHCMVNFWTDRAHIPTSADMRVEDLAVMTAAYERHPDYPKPVLNLACWPYPNREVAERAKCTNEPGAKVPWKR